jgi:hypothetical protein
MPVEMTASLQQNLITLLCHSNEAGKIVANTITPDLFEGEYRTIAERAITFWRKFHKAPGDHTPDLVAEIIEDKGNKKRNTYSDILHGMHDLADTINATYVLSQMSTFVRMQHMKDAITKSAEQINRDQHVAVEEIEKVWANLLRVSSQTFDPGTRLLDLSKMFEYLESTSREFSMGISLLDKRNIVPQRGTLTMFEAATGAGKSWFVINVGVANYQLRKKVLHLSLENSEEETLLRYIQRIMSMTKRRSEDRVRVVEFVYESGKFDKSFKELVSLKPRMFDPEWALDDNNVRLEVESHIGYYGTRVDNLIIKRFPMGALTPSGLRAYLDMLETSENFSPDIVLIDSPKLMRYDLRDPRAGIGHNVEQCNAISVERNQAWVGTHQLSKEGARAAIADLTHTSEDWSVVQTADIVLIMSRTDAEADFGLARLAVAKARREKDKWLALLTQSYDIGQFCLDAVQMWHKHNKLIKELTGEGDEEDDEED